VTSRPYRLRLAPGAARTLAEVLPERIALAAYTFITGPLVENLRRDGKPLAPPLAPAWSARRGDYRVLYLIDDEAREVRVTAVRRRGMRTGGNRRPA
jgi:mRNA-degrading endonuclease RelE of RelBE toxin-antitoxin system